MVKYVWFFVFIVSIVFAVICIKTKLNILAINKQQDSDKKILTPKSDLLGVGIIISFGMLLMSFFELQSNSSQDLGVMFILFAVVGIVFMMAWMDLIIIYDEKGFSVGWFRFRLKYYLYEDIQGFTVEEMEDKNGRILNRILHIGKRKIESENYSKKYKEFEEYAFSRYKEKMGDYPPEIDELIYGDFFLTKEEYVAVKEKKSYIQVFLWLILIVIIAFIYARSEDVDKTNSDYIEVEMIDAWMLEDSLRLQSNMHIHDFKIYITEENEQDLYDLQRKIDDKEKLYLYVRTGGGKNNSHYTVYHAEDESGHVYISFEEVNEIVKEEDAFYIYILTASFAILTVYYAYLIFQTKRKRKNK